MSDFTHLAVSISVKRIFAIEAGDLLDLVKKSCRKYGSLLIVFIIICVTFCMIYYAYLYRSQ